MEILRALKNMTADECREVGAILVRLADSPRDAAWEANMSRAIAQFEAAPAPGFAEQLERLRVARAEVCKAIDAEGMGHRKLIEQELARRGDARSYEQFAEDVGGIHSDI